MLFADRYHIALVFANMLFFGGGGGGRGGGGVIVSVRLSLVDDTSMSEI